MMEGETIQQPIAESNKNTNTQVDNSLTLLDSLPYLDVVHPDYEEYALSLIEQEMQGNDNNNTGKLHPKADHQLSSTTQPPSLSSVEKRLRHLKQEQSGSALVPQFRSVQPDKNDNVEDWTQAVKMARIEYELERQCSILLEIEKTAQNNNNHWKQHLEQLERLAQQLDHQGQVLQAQLDRVHVQRQEYQQKSVGISLQRLSTKWQGLIEKRYQLQIGIQQLRQQQREG